MDKVVEFIKSLGSFFKDLASGLGWLMSNLDQVALIICLVCVLLWMLGSTKSPTVLWWTIILFTIIKVVSVSI